jgi:methionine sulfoxide reductase heme-binding subunit
MDVAGRINGLLRHVPPWVVYLSLALPLAVLVWRAMSGGLGPDPVRTLERSLGETGLQLIVAGLVVTPLRRLSGINLIRYRRAIGVMAFAYIALHLTVWISLDLAFRWAEIGADLLKRPYIIVGMIGFLALLPLAVTSNNLSVRKLGPVGWKRLHRLTYVAAVAGAVHYLMLVKAWPLEPILYAVAVAVLLALRLWWTRGRVATRPA